MTVYRKTFRLRISMNAGLELDAPIDRNVSKALAFFLRALAVGILIYTVRWW